MTRGVTTHGVLLAFWAIGFGGVTLFSACELDDVGFLGADTGLAGVGGLAESGNSAAGASRGGAGACLCTGPAQECNAEGDCVPRCSLEGGCAGAATEPGVVPDAFGCRGEPASQDDLVAEWADDRIPLEAELRPENQHLLIERSSAMSEQWNEGTRWSSMLGALLSLPQPLEDTTRTLRFFPAAGGAEAACDTDSYLDPVAVYDSAGFDSSSLLALGSLLDPAGPNPMVSAVAGAFEGIAEHRSLESRAGDRLVLVIGSYPDHCVGDSALEEVAELVAEALELEPPIRTSVIVIGDEVNVDPIANAADSAPYRIVEGDDGSSLARALRAGQSCDGVGLGATPSITAPRGAEWERLEVLLDGPGQESTIERVPELANSEQCSESQYGGWYFEDPEDRSHLSLCECSSLRASCATVHVVGAGALE